MLLRTTVALALILGSASGSLAAQKKHTTNSAQNAFASSSLTDQKQQHSTNPRYDVYNVRGQYVGSDPDATVRAQIARDPGVD